MRQILTLLLTLAALIAFLPGQSKNVTAADWSAKVAPGLLPAGKSTDVEFLVFLTTQADLGPAASLSSRAAKNRFVFETLTHVADETQPPLLKALADLPGVKAYRPYWVVNMIWVRGDLAAVEFLAKRADVAYLYANPSVRLAQPLAQTSLPVVPTAVEWNVNQINAPAVWAAGTVGAGAVVAGQDTGYDWDHPALISQYRGWDGAAADHNYHWHDAIHEDNPNSPAGNPCGFDSPEPCDDNNHGTHTMGTMVGDDGSANQIGVAPGAKWIACRNMEQGWGSPVTYSECFQWFIAPTDLNGLNPDLSLAPHVINNSWSCPVSEGCTDPNIMLAVVENVRAAGIVVVSSAGNTGSACSTVNTPAAIYDATLTVGATSNTDTIASFSSRGPVTVDDSGRLKPDVSAPGVSIRSSIRDGAYGFFNGTSQAAPHVAGLVALLISANPTLAGQVDWIETAILSSALPLTTTQECGGLPGNQIPNNTFGAGRIDALAAYNAIAPEILLPMTVNWSDASQSDRLVAFLGGNRLTDSDGHEGTWTNVPSINGLLFSYPPGKACQALGLGWLAGPNTAHGLLYCRDGSGLRATWETTEPPADRVRPPQPAP